MKAWTEFIKQNKTKIDDGGDGVSDTLSIFSRAIERRQFRE